MTTNESIDTAAQRLSIVMGVSAADAAAGIQEALNRLNKVAESNIKGFEALGIQLERIEEQRRQERWATDPMGLMGWLSLNQWRWFMADRITDLMEVLNVLADWVTPE